MSETRQEPNPVVFAVSGRPESAGSVVVVLLQTPSSIFIIIILLFALWAASSLVTSS